MILCGKAFLDNNPYLFYLSYRSSVDAPDPGFIRKFLQPLNTGSPAIWQPCFEEPGVFVAKGRNCTLRLSQIAVGAGPLGPNHYPRQSETCHTG